MQTIKHDIAIAFNFFAVTIVLLLLTRGYHLAVTKLERIAHNQVSSLRYHPIQRFVTPIAS